MSRAIAARVRAVRARVAERLRVSLPDARVEERADGVAVEGRRLVRRWVDDPSLAWWRQ